AAVPSWREAPLSETERLKVLQILSASRDRNLNALRDLATSEGGLIEDEVRRTAWPVLLGTNGDQQGAAQSEWKLLPKHKDEDQVQLDVNRAFVYYPEDESTKRTDARKQELSNVIVAVLRTHPMLHYFQGYHDIVQVLLLVLGADAAVPAVAQLSLLRIRDFMLPTMKGTEPHLQLVPTIIHAVDPGLYKHLSNMQPFFALAATLTLYAHDIEEYGDIARLFDFLLASAAVTPLYLYAAIVISRKQELLDFEADEPEMLYAVLSKLPKPLDLDELIQQTMAIFRAHPPESLPGMVWPQVSSNSVLKTTRDPRALSQQTLSDGERMFEKQAAELERAEFRKRTVLQMQQLARHYKRPAGLTGIAIAVAVLAYW
ncbi:hypothetical protein BAUCODRAFT_51760, partial [Baudoinia panamericana UAMH 10762]